MIEWLRFTDTQRKVSIDQAAILSGIIPKALEKDWWVTLTLKALFTTPYAPFFIFKGGTSLSKGWKIIERFSEDIDMALDPAAFGKEYKMSPSHSYVKNLKKEGCSFTSTVLKEALEKQLATMGIPENMVTVVAAPIPETLPDRDPQTLFVKYTSLYSPNPYIADEVKLEFSVRSLKAPFSPVSILSILSEMTPNAIYEEQSFKVMAVEPHKTLMEKALLLHEKFITRNNGQISGERQSRHLYDLVRMMDTGAGKQAIKDRSLYDAIVEHRKGYIRLKGVDYDSLLPSTLSFVPPDDMIDLFRQDYWNMQQNMIYGDSLDFDALIKQLSLLNQRFKAM